MPRFNVVTGQAEYMPWELQGIDSSQAQALPPEPQAAQPQALPGPAMMMPSGEINPDGYNQLLNEARTLQKNDRATSQRVLAGQESGISQLEQNLNELKNLGPAINFKPLMAAFDSLYGTNQAQTSGDVETPEQRAARLFELQNKIQMAKDQLSENRIKFSNQDLAHLMNKSRLVDSKQQRYDESQVERADADIRKNFDKLSTSINDSAEGFDALYKGLQPNAKGEVPAGNIAALAGTFARTIGKEKGALSEGDVKRTFLDNLEMKMARLKAQVGSDPNVGVSAEAVQSALDLIEQAREISMSKYKSELNTKAKLYGTAAGKGMQRAWGITGEPRTKELMDKINSSFSKREDPKGNLDAEFDAYKKSLRGN